MTDETSTRTDVEHVKQVSIGTLCHPIDSQQLFDSSREIFIRHGEELYRLTITRNGKLILQK